MLKSTTVLVLVDDAAERAWIQSALPDVKCLIVLNDLPTVQVLIEEAAPACLIASAETDKGPVVQLLRELRRRGSNLPTIVIGSHLTFRTAVEIARLDATDLLERPFSQLRLRSAVLKMCASRLSVMRRKKKPKS